MSLRRGAQALMCVSLVAIALLTLSPRPANTAHDPSWCLRCAHLGARDVILNILLFVPLGASLALLGARARTSIFLAFAMSLAVETAQWLFLPGRQASIVDLLTNTIGGLAGVVLVRATPYLLDPSPTLARWLATVLATIWVAQLAFTSWALQRVLPPDRIYWGQWQHVFRATEPFPGKVLAFSINGRPIPDDSLVDHYALLSGVPERGMTIDAASVEGAPVPTRAQIVGLADDHGNLLAGITQEECGNRLIVRMRGDDLGLAAPTARVSRTCLPGATTMFSAFANRKELALSTERNSVRATHRQSLRPTMGWALLAPSSSMIEWDAWFSVLWVLFFAVPIAWLLTRSGRVRVATWLAYALVMPGAAVLVAIWSGSSMPAVDEWIAMGIAPLLAYFAWAAWRPEIRAAR